MCLEENTTKKLGSYLKIKHNVSRFLHLNLRIASKNLAEVVVVVVEEFSPVNKRPGSAHITPQLQALRSVSCACAVRVHGVNKLFGAAEDSRRNEYITDK